MISQEKRLIITFRCTTDAIAMEKSCKATGAPGRLIPVPREITAGCGLSFSAPIEEKEQIYNLPAADFPGVRPPQAALPLRNYFRSKTWILRAYMSV